MKKLSYLHHWLLACCFAGLILSCNSRNQEPSSEAINAINLKRGAMISCGPPDKQFGAVNFQTSCSGNREDFDLAMALLHSFEYDEAEKMFAKIIDEEPGCAMAYWGVAMSNYHPLWAPPAAPELEKGARAIDIARSITQKTTRESDYIEAIGVFYKDWDKLDHRTRAIRFEKAMEKLYATYATDKEAGILYALSLDASADPADKTFANQKKAFSILSKLYPNEPDHPGIVHYIIHSYDYPELAALALPAARKYAGIAPSSAHALHMPSHIFTRLGLWEECIQSNLAAAASAKCYAEDAGIKGHWDEELHALDYLMYGYLQQGDNVLAKKQWDYLKTINEVSPMNFKVAYAFAAIPARYVLENKLWKDAADLKAHKEDFDWQKYPWQKAIIHFARLMGAVNTGNTAMAKTELQQLNKLHTTLVQQKDDYKANQVMIQAKAGEAWILLKENKAIPALAAMQAAVDMEGKTEKHPVTPGEVIPALELLGDMYLQLNQPAKALEAYEKDLAKNPNRFNALYSAGLASEKSNNLEKARKYYSQLSVISGAGAAVRPELEMARAFLQKHPSTP